MATVLTVGITVHDIILQVDAMPAGDSKSDARQRRQVIGGIAANAAIAIARLGGHSLISTRLGHDPHADEIMAVLTEAKVDTQAVEWVNGAKTSLSSIIVDAKGDRLLVNHADPLLFRGSPGDYGELDADINVVMADTRWAEGVNAALKFATAQGIPSLIDFDRLPEKGGENILRDASHIAFGQQALIDLTGAKTPEAGLRRASEMSGAWLAVTAGSSGVYWLDNDEVHHFPAYEVEAVDTLGAGDVFHGALALAFAEKMAINEAIRFASAAAAIKCCTLGGGSGAPTRRELEQFIKDNDK